MSTEEAVENPITDMNEMELNANGEQWAYAVGEDLWGRVRMASSQHNPAWLPEPRGHRPVFRLLDGILARRKAPHRR